MEENLRWLRQSTGVHVHADLIVGLPGEDRRSFGAGFDRLLALDPQEIQVGILKRLRGAPIARHTDDWQMIYSASPPYEILQTSTIDFATMQQFRRFARYWDLVANSGHYSALAPLIWQDTPSPFEAFWAFGSWLHDRVGQTHGIARARLRRLMAEYLVTVCGHEEARVQLAVSSDERPIAHRDTLPARQARHLSRAAAGHSATGPDAASVGTPTNQSQ